jgi:hypothetical protein
MRMILRECMVDPRTRARDADIYSLENVGPNARSTPATSSVFNFLSNGHVEEAQYAVVEEDRRGAKRRRSVDRTAGNRNTGPLR